MRKFPDEVGNRNRKVGKRCRSLADKELSTASGVGLAH